MSTFEWEFLFLYMQFSKSFIRFNWIALIFIYAVVIAGSFVRISGSGMGCPDWPKCFGQWVPPTEASDLPENYKDIYSNKREKKVKKFTRFLESIGLEETAIQLKNDPSIYIEQDFNSRKTWTEYVNRLVGFLAGNALLLCFLWILLKYRKRKLVILTAVNLILLAIEAWFGSIVVASNLVPWTITVHMLLALVIIAIQLYVIYMISPKHGAKIHFSKWMMLIIWVSFAITFYQMFLGTQVRESIDHLTKQGIGREGWIDGLGIQFYIHRSFSWLVLVLLAVLAYINEANEKYSIIRFIFVALSLELVGGVLMAYMDVPGLVQTSHLVFATMIFGGLSLLVFRARVAK